jgi:hypothetical protein
MSQKLDVLYFQNIIYNPRLFFCILRCQDCNIWKKQFVGCLPKTRKIDDIIEISESHIICGDHFSQNSFS